MVLYGEDETSGRRKKGEGETGTSMRWEGGCHSRLKKEKNETKSMKAFNGRRIMGAEGNGSHGIIYRHLFRLFVCSFYSSKRPLFFPLCCCLVGFSSILSLTRCYEVTFSRAFFFFSFM